MAADLRKKLKNAGSLNRETRNYRTKSVDYLVDKTAREETEPPENQLKKVLCDDDEYDQTRLSAHELRFRKSLEKLQIPDWYLKSDYYTSNENEYDRFSAPYSCYPSSTTPSSPGTYSWWNSYGGSNRSHYSRRGSSPRQDVKAQTPIIVAKFSEPPRYVNSKTSPDEVHEVKMISTSPKYETASTALATSPTDYSKPLHEHKSDTVSKYIILKTFKDQSFSNTKHTDLTKKLDAPKVEIASASATFETNIDDVVLQPSQKSDSFFIPKNFFEKYKWELEEARRNRINLRQHNNIVYSDGKLSDAPISNAENVKKTVVAENNESKVAKEPKLKKEVITPEKKSINVVKSSSDFTWRSDGAPESPAPENRNANLKLAEKVLISPSSEKIVTSAGIPFSTPQSVVVEVSDVLFAGRLSGEIKHIDEPISLKEVFDNFFELSKITPSVHLAQNSKHVSQDSSEKNKLSKSQMAQYGIYTTNQSLMATCAKDPKNAGNLLKKETLQLKCEMCMQSHRINGSRDPYVSCLYCYTYYCNRLCRKRGWKRHVQKCDYAKVSSVCRKILTQVRNSAQKIELIFEVARLGYERRGRGCVNFVFRSFDVAKKFLENPSTELSVEKFFYQTLSELEVSKSDLSETCRTYDPMSSFLLNVCVVIAIDDVAETPGSERRLSDVIISDDKKENAKTVSRVDDNEEDEKTVLHIDKKENKKTVSRIDDKKQTEKPLSRVVEKAKQFIGAKRQFDISVVDKTAEKEKTVSHIDDEAPKQMMQRAKSLPYRKKSKNQLTDAQILKSVLKSLENIAPDRSADESPPELRRKSSTPVSPSEFDRKNVYRHTVGISGRKYFRSTDGNFSPINCKTEFKFPVTETDV